jgi:membrane protein DedA with SNARE-associated domain
MVHLVARYGYVVIALLVGAEGVGIPLPGETALLAGAALAARGDLSFAGVVLAAAVGVALGGMGGYGIGRTAGHAVVVRYGSWLGITSPRLNRAHRFFEEHGTGAVLIGRFVPVVRILTGIIAGVIMMPFKQFVAYNTLAGIIWSLVIGTIGYLFGDLGHLERRFGWPEMVVAGFILLGLIGVVHWRLTRVNPPVVSDPNSGTGGPVSPSTGA